MKCGNCKGDHPAVADVRACYEHAGKATVAAPRPSTATADRAPAPEPEKVPDVPAGRYAILAPDRTGSEVLKFFRIDIPTEGRWKGYVFVKEQASDDLYPVRDKDRRNAILRKIAEDPRKAMLEYGRKIGKCGHCGRTLTDEESRAYGIGPVCRNKMRF